MVCEMLARVKGDAMPFYEKQGFVRSQHEARSHAINLRN